MHTSNKQSLRSITLDLALFAILIIVLGWMSSKSVENLGYYWQWYQIPDFLFTMDKGHVTLGPLLEGLKITFFISFIGLFFTLLIGLVTALLRLSSSPIGRGIAIFYLEISRNTPLLIQIFFIYFVVGPILDIDRIASAILALSLFEGAYASEIFRSGILSIERGQHEAAASLGLTNFARYRLVVLPQALRVVTPPLTSQIISLIKDSALVSTIAIYDLSMQAQALVAETYLSFEIWFCVALIYLSINIFLSVIVYFLDQHFNRKN